MAVMVPTINGHIQNHLTRSLERILEEANQSGDLKLSNRKLKDFPKAKEKYNLSDTVTAGKGLQSFPLGFCPNCCCQCFGVVCQQISCKLRLFALLPSPN